MQYEIKNSPRFKYETKYTKSSVKNIPNMYIIMETANPIDVLSAVLPLTRDTVTAAGKT